MDDSGLFAFDAAALAGPALGFGVGSMVAGFAALTAWSNAYMNANPATGSVSGGSPLTLAALFVVGAAVMYVSAFAGLDRTLDATD